MPKAVVTHVHFPTGRKLSGPRAVEPQQRVAKPIQARKFHLNSPRSVSSELSRVNLGEQSFGPWLVEKSFREGLAVVTFKSSREDGSLICIPVFDGTVAEIRFVPRPGEAKSAARDRIGFALTMTPNPEGLPFFDLLREVFA